MKRTPHLPSLIKERRAEISSPVASEPRFQRAGKSSDGTAHCVDRARTGGEQNDAERVAPLGHSGAQTRSPADCAPRPLASSQSHASLLCVAPTTLRCNESRPLIVVRIVLCFGSLRTDTEEDRSQTTRGRSTEAAAHRSVEGSTAAHSSQQQHPCPSVISRVADVRQPHSSVSMCPCASCNPSSLCHCGCHGHRAPTALLPSNRAEWPQSSVKRCSSHARSEHTIACSGMSGRVCRPDPLLTVFCVLRAQWLAECCAATCNALTKACGQMCECCDDLCAALGRCCAECCDDLSRCCGAMCTSLGEVFSKPFSGVVFLGLLMSLVPFVAIIYYLIVGWGAVDCAKRLDIWLAVCLACYVLNFFFAIYLFKKLSNERWDDPAVNPKYDPNKHEEINQFNHAAHFFLYDPWVCLYITVGIFMIVWGIVGLAWANQSSMCEQARLQQVTIAAAIILLVYIVVFVIGCLCSLYSGFITVCVNDCDPIKCLFCYVYYPCCYDHEKVRKKYYKDKQRLEPRSPPPQQAAPRRFQGPANARALGGNQNQPRQPIQPIQPPPQYSNILPMAPPVAQPVAQPVGRNNNQGGNLGGNVYYNPQQRQSQPVSSPQYQQAPVNYAQPYQANQQNHGLLQQQQQSPINPFDNSGYPPQQMQQPYAPPAQYSPAGPVYAQMPPPQSSQPSPYSQPPQQQQYAPAPSHVVIHQDGYGQEEGVPYAQEGQQGNNAPGGAPFAQAHPVAQPVQQQGAGQQQPGQQPGGAPAPQPEKSSAAKAADAAKESAKAAADKLKAWWGKP